MAIQRWEMLLSARADSYLLKIQGPRADVDRIIQAHPDVCQDVQEISDDIFQWAVFVIDAPLSERLAIQNMVMSLTVDPSGNRPSNELTDVLDGLSGALESLTNLTDDEHAFVMKKLSGVANAAAPIPPPPLKTPTDHPATAPQARPPAGTPLPSVNIPGKMAMPGVPAPIAKPASPNPFPPSTGNPSRPGSGIPLPSVGPIPGIVRPVQPPKPVPMPTAPGVSPAAKQPLPPVPVNRPAPMPPPTAPPPPIFAKPVPPPQAPSAPPPPPFNVTNPAPPPQAPSAPPPPPFIVTKPAPPPQAPSAPPPPPSIVTKPAPPPQAASTPLVPPSAVTKPASPFQTAAVPPLPTTDKKPASPPSQAEQILPPPQKEIGETSPSTVQKQPWPVKEPSSVSNIETGHSAQSSLVPQKEEVPVQIELTQKFEEMVAPDNSSTKHVRADKPSGAGIEPMAVAQVSESKGGAKPVVTPFGPAVPTGNAAPDPAPPSATKPPQRETDAKTIEDPSIRVTIFYPIGGEAPKDRFTSTMMEMTQKKSKKPMAFQVVNSVPTTVALEHSTEWIWTAKANGANCFFVILPPDVMIDLMEPILAEAQEAGIRCFLVPQADVGSKLLYMDLMVELMMIKRRGK